jgi:ABC-2 type transport system ATP-binding protein
MMRRIAMASEAIASHNLLKIYEGDVEALKAVAVSIERGELYTLLGPNGAGKTTFLRIISTQLMPTKGTAEVLGYDVLDEAGEVRRHIAVVPQDVAAYGNYTPWDYAYYFAKLRGMASLEAKQCARKALEAVELLEMRNRVCASLSGGEKKRAIIASALASQADILMLDEPTSGLDAVARRGVWSALRDMVRDGKTILLTTHIMEEAEMVSDRLAIIDHGNVVAQGSPEKIKRLAKERFRVVVKGEMKSLAMGHEVAKLGDKQIVYVNSEDEALELVRTALEKGLNAEASPITLEDAFVKLVGGWNH